MRSPKSTVALALMLVAWSAVSAPASKPMALEFGSHGMGFGPSLELKHGRLACQVRNSSMKLKRVKVRQPSGDDWRQFRAALDDLKVWRWQDGYSNMQIVDGTHWHLSIKYPDAAIESDGLNEYPDFDGRPAGMADPSPAFERLLTALRKLAPGCPI